MEKYYKINEIAKFFNINTSAIRYYEQYGVLTPAYINPVSKYRYYDLSNVNTVAYIIELRHSGMSMDKIKEYLNDNFSREEFVSQLETQKSYIENLIRINKEKIAQQNKYDVKILTIEEMDTYSIQYEAIDLNQIFKRVYEFLFLAVKNATIINSSTVYIEFDSLEPEYSNVKFKVGIESLKNKNTTHREKFRAIRTYHKGPYETLGNAYSALVEYAKENNLQLKGNALEYYHESFNLRIDPKDNLTEVLLPIVD